MESSTSSPPRDAPNGGRAAAPRVSVIVPARNAEAVLPALLGRLAAQTLSREDFEVIVADDCSTDATAAVVASLPGARLVSGRTPSGSFGARNLGAAAARGEFLAFTDADCLPEPDWLERALAAFADPTLDLLAGGIHMPLGPRPSTAALVDSARCLDQERYVREGFGATANLVVRRTVFESVGGFQRKIISGGDTEFCHRAVAAGAVLRYGPEARVVHAPRETARELRRKGYRLGYGAAQQRFYADGPLRERPLYWAHVGTWLPKGGVPGLHRIAVAGYRLTRVRRARMHALHYLSFRLPIAVGNLAGTVVELYRTRIRPR